MPRRAVLQLSLLAIAAMTFAWTLRATHGPALPAPFEDPFTLTLRVTDDEGAAVAGTEIVINEQDRALSDDQGLLTLTLLQRDESGVDVRLVCPKGFITPRESIRLVLEPVANGDLQRHYERHAVCVVERHTAILVVKAPTAGLLPVVVGDHVVGFTDASGEARFVYRLKPRSTLKVRIDTSSKPEIEPQHPERSFVMGEKDTLFVFEQSFEISRRPASTRALPENHLPYRIN